MTQPLQEGRGARYVPSPLLTLSEVADILGLHRSTLYRGIERGSFPLPIVRVGSTMRVPRAAVSRLLAGTEARPANPHTLSSAPEREPNARGCCPACGAIP
jgi:excisionase family DNA binding protein